MKRSEINRAIRDAEVFIARMGFRLPPLASWTPERFRQDSSRFREILDCGLGWDITDFGRGCFHREGLLLFTLRNGVIGVGSVYPKSYAEKIMVVRENQVTLTHCHARKTEDIINRGGGRLTFRLHHGDQLGNLDADKSVTASRDGIAVTTPPGGLVVLEPGESLTLEPGVYHSFWGEENSGDVLVGEVSSVNDDHTDNVYHGEQLRFPSIDEDETPYRMLVKDYQNITDNG